MKNRKSMITAFFATAVVAGALAFSSIDAQAAETFDPVFYVATYADVAAAFGTDANALYNHYTTYGRSEGRKAFVNAVGGEEVSGIIGTDLPEFDPIFYANTYADVAAAFGTDANALYNHYINCGRSEGRKAFVNAVGGEAVRSSVSDNIAKITDISNMELAQYETHQWYDLGDSFVYIAEYRLDQPLWEDVLVYASVLDERYPNGNAVERSGGAFMLVDGRYAYYAATSFGCPNLNNFADKYGY